MKNMYDLWIKRVEKTIDNHKEILNKTKYDWIKMAFYIEDDNRLNTGFPIWRDGE